MSKRKFSGNISGKGYYIALILCAVAIGISGYLYYRNANDTQTNMEEPSAVVDATNQADVQAVATQPTQPAPNTEPAGTTAQTEASWELELVSPVSGQTISDYAVDCLSYNQTTRDWRTHDGVDIAAEAGAAVCAAADGEVYSVYEDETMGMTVVIVHADGYSTRYASLDQEVLVSPGDLVEAGQQIGCVGQTALLENAIGDHVHFSVFCNDESVNPEDFLN